MILILHLEFSEDGENSRLRFGVSSMQGWRATMEDAVELCDEDEFVVLACDGIWDCMSSQQLVDFVREQLKSESKLSVVCEKVLDRCLAPTTASGEGCDNMTMILVQFKKPTSSGTSSDEKSSTSEEAEAEPKPAENES
ncbi:putative protein phosphatase 2C 60 [Sesamum angolense]|uniref:PPM-type phosphatase domain-containing protein n=1 Tax=Sesamum angolense TaxID=2727404 RepID=A0AAE1W8Z4_9LAMI|nr:putative protein phosphatase 2C 60 [Sesamum angolense]